MSGESGSSHIVAILPLYLTLSTSCFSLGYDLEFFGFIRQYLFFPWICLVIVVFAITEVKTRSLCRKNDATLERGSILTMENDDELPEITIDMFLTLTKHGNALSIIDGYVIDIGHFIDVHPGGANVLRFAIGCDISQYFVGELDVNGQRHKHSPRALRALRPLVKWKLTDQGQGRRKSLPGRSSHGAPLVSRGSGGRRSSVIQALRRKSPGQSIRLHGHVFRNAKIVGHEIISTNESADQKCIIRLSICLKREDDLDCVLGIPLPTSTFIFRVVDSQGNAFERPYNSARCYISAERNKTNRPSQ